jgi:hypothetical protein
MHAFCVGFPTLGMVTHSRVYRCRTDRPCSDQIFDRSELSLPLVFGSNLTDCFVTAKEGVQNYPEACLGHVHHTKVLPFIVVKGPAARVLPYPNRLKNVRDNGPCNNCRQITVERR